MSKRMTQDDARVGARVAELRGLRGLTQTDLGRHLGMSFQQVQKYEKATNAITVGRLSVIARVLDAPVSYFFQEVEQGAEPVDLRWAPKEVEAVRALRAMSAELRERALALLSSLVPPVQGKKRRGRPPGSKNKPQPPAPEVGAAAAP